MRSWWPVNRGLGVSVPAPDGVALTFIINKSFE